MTHVYANVPHARACPSCQQSPLRHLAPSTTHAWGCVHCGGLWLAPELAGQLTFREAVVGADARRRAEAARPTWNCPQCTSSLTLRPVSALPMAWLDTCATHGTWLERAALPAVSPAASRVHLARARAGQYPNDREQLASIDALLRATQSLVPSFLVSKLPSERTGETILGLARVLNRGREVVAPNGDRATLLPAQPRGVILRTVAPWILGVAALGISIGLGATLLGSSELELADAAFLGATLGAFFTLIPLFGLLPFGALAVAERRRSVMVDGPKRRLVVSHNGKVTLSIRFDLVSQTRVRIHTRPDYEDLFNVLVTLPVAELWIHQTNDENQALMLARSLATTLGVNFEPEMERVP